MPSGSTPAHQCDRHLPTHWRRIPEFGMASSKGRSIESVSRQISPWQVASSGAHAPANACGPCSTSMSHSSASSARRFRQGLCDHDRFRIWPAVPPERINLERRRDQANHSDQTGLPFTQSVGVRRVSSLGQIAPDRLRAAGVLRMSSDDMQVHRRHHVAQGGAKVLLRRIPVPAR